MDYRFVKEGKSLIAVDAGWQENGFDVFDVQLEDGTFLDTVMVHPLSSIENTINDWINN